MMKRLILLLAIVVPCMLTGCDAFRKLAGRPTSADIEAKRIEIQAVEEAVHQARLDSLRRVEKRMADSLAVLDSIARGNITLLSSSEVGGVGEASSLEYRYYIIVGSFIGKGNAAAFKSKVEDCGYPATLIKFKNGYTAVGVCPSDNIVESFSNLGKVGSESFSPKGIWIFDRL